MKNTTSKNKAIKPVIIIAILVFMSFISASCSDGQVDINSASAKELDKITGVGEAIAQRIIDNRTYDSIDDLLRVKGIGEATLAKIKTQGVACLEEETVPEKKVRETITKKEETKSETEEVKETAEQQPVAETKQLPVINLNSEVSKSIKTENNKESLAKNLPLYGTFAFAAVFGAVFLLKQRKIKHGFE